VKAPGAVVIDRIGVNGEDAYAQKLIPDMSKKSTANVSRLLVGAREEEMIPWEWIVDETRGVEGVATYKDVAEFGESMTRRFRKDFWQHQPAWLMVMLEKSTVSGVIRPVLERYAVDFLVMHGFGSATAMHDLAETSRYCGGYAQDTLTSDPDELEEDKAPATAVFEGQFGRDLLQRKSARQ
jgi:hypothetical protein